MQIRWRRMVAALGLRRVASVVRRSGKPTLVQAITASSPRTPVDEPPDRATADQGAVANAIATLEQLPPRELQKLGYHFQRRDYYSALNDLEFLAANEDLWQGRAMPAGIDWHLSRQLALLREIAHYIGELADVPSDPPAESLAGYHWNNDFWRGTDALVHYALLRYLRPSRIVEIGCGWSSLLMARALARNDAERGVPTSVHQIEPYPRRELMRELPSRWTLEETILQRASLVPVEQLGVGDVLFYDGSHVARVASDVNWFFFELLPRISPGVVVHVHDIFWPADYPESWIFDRGQTWNEQYLLQAFLMFNSEFEVLLANAALVAERREARELLEALSEPVSGGGSVWIRRRAN
jgi:predicted O-methyltransferase YrrM